MTLSPGARIWKGHSSFGFDTGGTPNVPRYGTTSSDTPSIEGGSVSPSDWSSASPGWKKMAIRTWATNACRAEGVDEKHWVPLLEQVASRETGDPGQSGTGNPNTVNMWDSNAQKNTPSIGLAQVIQDNAPGQNLLNPVTNFRAAIRYMKSEYGDISNVPEAQGIQRGYDTGGSPDYNDITLAPGSDNLETGKGRWGFPYSGSSESRAGDTTHEWEIAPTDAPQRIESPYGPKDSQRTQTYYIDPEQVSVQPGGQDEFGFTRPKVVPNDPNAITDFRDIQQDSEGMLWRGMSDEEYQQAAERGYFQSDAGYNLGDAGSFQMDKTFFSTKFSQAANYATGFAPWQYQPTFTRPAHVIGISDRPDLARGPLGTDPASTEVGVPGQIPFKDIKVHWTANATAITPGDMYYRPSDWPGEDVVSRGGSPSVQVVWKQAETPTPASKVSIPYQRNNTGMRQYPGFGQEFEPWGRYVSPDAGMDLREGWERGVAQFDNPLYVEHKYGDWKKALAEKYGATGKELSDKLIQDGYDGVITEDKFGINEIVDIRPSDQRVFEIGSNAAPSVEIPEESLGDYRFRYFKNTQAIIQAMREAGENPDLGTGFTAPAVEVTTSDGNRIGTLEWYPDGTPKHGEVSMIKVEDEFQRRGIGTQMYDWAKQFDSALHHSDLQSGAGYDWAQAEMAREQINDPLLDALDDEPKTDVDEILDLLGVQDKSSDSPEKVTAAKDLPEPVEGVERGWERYYDDMLATEDATDSAHLWLTPEQLDPYKEYDRATRQGGHLGSEDGNYQAVRKAIEEHGGIRRPIILDHDGTNALITEGNHRLAIAKELGIDRIPVRVRQNDTITRNDLELGNPPAQMSDELKSLIAGDDEKSTLPSTLEDAVQDKPTPGARIWKGGKEFKLGKDGPGLGGPGSARQAPKTSIPEAIGKVGKVIGPGLTAANDIFMAYGIVDQAAQQGIADQLAKGNVIKQNPSVFGIPSGTAFSNPMFKNQQDATGRTPEEMQYWLKYGKWPDRPKAPIVRAAPTLSGFQRGGQSGNLQLRREFRIRHADGTVTKHTLTRVGPSDYKADGKINLLPGDKIELDGHH